MDLFKMANQIAKNMSNDDKESIEGMDMEKMISHVTQNVFKMMGSTHDGDPGVGGMPDIMGMMAGMSFKQAPEAEIEELEQGSDSESELIFPKTRDICFDLNVDLEDFYSGKKKKLNVKRKRIIEVDGKQKVIEEKKKLVIPIERGMKDEQQITFQGEADQIPGYSPGDIIITLIENEHPVFQRDADNLLIVKNINLYELYDITFDITHLNGDVLRVTKNSTDSLHLNDSLRKITGQGMPVYKSDTFGDLFIRFNLVIPKTIEQNKLKVFKDIFGQTDTLVETFTKKCVLENVSETDIEDLASDYTDSDTESGSETDSESVSSLSSESDTKRRPKRR